MNCLLLFFAILIIPQSIKSMETNQQEKEDKLRSTWAKLRIAESKMMRAGSGEGYNPMSSMRSMYISECNMLESELEAIKKELPADRVNEVLNRLKGNSAKPAIAEEKLKTAWGFLKMLEAKSRDMRPSLFINEQFAKARYEIESLKKELPDGRGDAIIKQLEEK